MMEHKFKTTIKPYLYNREGIDYQPCEDFDVEGTIYIDLKSWGINDFDLVVESITGSYYDFDDESDKEIIFLFSEFTLNYDCDDLQVKDIDIDLDKKTIHVS